TRPCIPDQAIVPSRGIRAHSRWRACLTIHSSRRRFAARHNSSVRPQEMLMRYLITAILLMALSVGCPAQESSDLSTEVKSLLVEAQRGDTEAQLRVATAYDWGQGAPRSGSEATKWYTLAAQGGSAEAQNSLGSIFQADGHFSDALKWYRLAAKQEHAL